MTGKRSQIRLSPYEVTPSIPMKFKKTNNNLNKTEARRMRALSNGSSNRGASRLGSSTVDKKKSTGPKKTPLGEGLQTALRQKFAGRPSKLRDVNKMKLGGGKHTSTQSGLRAKSKKNRLDKKKRDSRRKLDSTFI